MDTTSEIHDLTSKINKFPSKVKRTCSIADSILYNKEDIIYLCGRLVQLNDSEKHGFLRDKSGGIKIQFSENNLQILEGDIVQVTGHVENNLFFVETYTKLVQGKYSQSAQTQDDHYSPWRDFINNPDKLEIIRFRSEFLQSIRDFFVQQDFIELDVASLVPASGMEPHIEPFTTQIKEKNGKSKRFFLHTSPEFAMKKMLVAGFEKIFYLGHVYRNGENTLLHNPEFTMLEWYRAYEDYTAIINDCKELIHFVNQRLFSKWSKLWRNDDLLTRDWQICTLADLMMKKCDFDLRKINENNQQSLVKVIRKQGIVDGDINWPIDDLFFLLFINLVEPGLGKTCPIIVKDYPIWMASLAKRKEEDPEFVQRFELYIDGVELANAFTELNDPDEQLHRLLKEQKQRKVLNRSYIPIDEDFIDALQTGMPPAAGIALGVDRLMMVLNGQNNISNVLSYSF